MRIVLSIDPGATRLGWNVIYERTSGLELVDSGIIGLERGTNEDYQPYKLRLIQSFVGEVERLFNWHAPTHFVNETQPAVGGGNFVAATQSELAKTVATIFQVEAYKRGVSVTQISASTIKKTLTGNGKATKAKVRNAVIEVFPHMSAVLKEESTRKPPVWDRSDSIATGIAFFSTVKV